MSDPVTNLEIEGVLSSIRRLVAEGDRVRSGVSNEASSNGAVSNGASSPVAPAPAFRIAPKFVLTAALRVDEPTVVVQDDGKAARPLDGPRTDVADDADNDAHASGSAAAQASDDGPLTLTHRVDLNSSQDGPNGVATWQASAATGLIEDDAATVGPTISLSKTEVPEPEPATTAVSDDTPFVLQPMANEPQSLSDTSPSFCDPVTGSPAPASDAAGRSRLEATIAELEAAITTQTDDWDPDGSELTPVMDWPEERGAALFYLNRPNARAHPGVVEDAEVVHGRDPAHPLSDSDDVGPQDHDNDDQDRDDPDTDEAAYDDVADLADDLSRPDDDRPHDQLDARLAAFLEDEQLLDEATLRALVVEIVRQELQGTLGERITRNVRKLVRREIYRMLASQELD